MTYLNVEDEHIQNNFQRRKANVGHINESQEVLDNF